MNKLIYISVAAGFLTACTDNSKQLQQLQYLHSQDSVLTKQSQGKDSAIVSYVKTLDEIQSNIDNIKEKEKIISDKSGGEPPQNILEDVKSLDTKIVSENRRIYQLERKLKKEDSKDLGLEKVIRHLTKELADKDAEIADLQTKLAGSDNSLKIITEQFNDSIGVIHKQREEINAMRSEVNTIYYALGSLKELKKHNVITKDGSIIGIGGATELKPDFNNSYFTQGDMTKIKDIPLNGKFEKLVTIHPPASYKISGDTLQITDPTSFWSESKYLVIELK